MSQGRDVHGDPGDEYSDDHQERSDEGQDAQGVSFVDVCHINYLSVLDRAQALRRPVLNNIR